uniref:Uncharacterized protein n=1 Tax=Rhizophora mucronata TaxID=61149 RepID=A0A2P2L420_RHIMU
MDVDSSHYSFKYMFTLFLKEIKPQTVVSILFMGFIEIFI